MIQKNNQRENESRVNYKYKVGDKVLYKRDGKANYQNDYERIRTELERTIIPATKPYLTARQSVLKEKGAKRAITLPVSGAFHSDLMEPAIAELKKGIDQTEFREPICNIYQNFTAKPIRASEMIKVNLLSQLTGAVLWTQSINEMVNDGITNFIEVGPGNTLQGLIRKINPEVTVSKI